ncbi:MAG: SBBP repeat-containing protein [Candidatus Hydrogenedentes bacterium]|nr:SBBP repeat-containing protein [Candidatus Hydrogenedentota bacterium]
MQHRKQRLTAHAVLACFYLSANLSVYAADGDLLWVRQMGATSADMCTSVAVDDAGNVYTTGRFAGTADFDPGPGTFNLVSGGSPDAFVWKLNGAGELDWAVQLDATLGYAIAVDNAHNVYVSGYFLGTVDFDPGPASYTLNSGPESDIFVMRLDESGALVWARQIAGTSSLNSGYAIAVDGSGNVYSAGFLFGTADFDPGPGVFDLASAGEYDIYVLKLDSSGGYLWARRMGGTEVDYAYSIAVDDAGSVYTAGTFQATADFDPGPATANLTSSTGAFEGFVSKLDESGNFIWVKHLDTTSGHVTGASLTLDTSNNLYLAGDFGSVVDFDPGPGSHNINAGSNNDIYVLKLDNTGNFAWVWTFNETIQDSGRGVAVDEAGNVYAVGASYNSAERDIMAVKLDSAGNVSWINQTGNSASNFANAIAVHSSGNAYVAGNFSDTVDFDPGPGLANLTSNGDVDIFVAKYTTDLKVSSIVRAGIDPPGGAIVEFTVTFTAPVSGVDESDFVVTATGTVNGSEVTSVSGSGTTYTVTVYTGMGAGTIRLDLVDDDSIVNGALEPLGGPGAGNGDFSTGDAYNIDVMLPVNWLYLLFALLLAGGVSARRRRKHPLKP